MREHLNGRHIVCFLLRFLRELLKRRMADDGRETELNWIKFGEVDSISIVGKDTVVLGYGNYIVFVEASRPDRKELVYRATNHVRGDGVECLCTHRSLPCFAFAEKCRNPRIIINAYPSFENMKILDACQEMPYMAVRFSEMEYLVALTHLPGYSLVIWNWRTAEKLCACETSIRDPLQVLRVSLTSPIYIAQATAAEARLNLWEMNMCCKRLLLTENPIRLPEKARAPHAYAWGFDGELYFVDSAGNLFSVNPESRSCELILECKGEGALSTPCLAWHKGGWAYTGSGNVHICRRKSPEGWTRIASFTPPTPFKALLSTPLKDMLIGWSELHELVHVRGEATVEYATVKSYGSSFDFLCYIYPVADFFVTYSKSRKTFAVWDKATGSAVSTASWTKLGDARDVKSNPKYPYVVVAQSTGKISLMNFHDHSAPAPMNEMYLTKSSLDAVRFHASGGKFCVANTEIGEFFLIKFHGDPKLEVIATIKLELTIVDFALMGELATAKLVVLPMSQLCCKSGQTLLSYGVHSSKKTFRQTNDATIPMAATAICPRNAKELFCVLHRSRAFCVVDAASGKIVEKVVTGHQLKSYSIQVTDDYLITYGFDGLVILRSSATTKCITLMMPHHRMSMGVKEAVIDSCCQYILTLGVDGTVVCFSYSGEFCDLGLKSEQEALLASAQLKQLLLGSAGVKGKAKNVEKQERRRESEAEEPEKEKAEKTWLEMREEEKIRQDEIHSRNDKLAIIEELEKIKNELRELLNANLKCSPQEQLPISSFDLDKMYKRKRSEDAKAEREKEKNMQLATIKARDKVSDYIQKTCWESTDIKGMELHGILSSTVVESYPLLLEPESKQQFWRIERIKMEKFYRRGDFFEPWLPMSASVLDLHLNATSHISDVNVAQTVKTKLKEDDFEDQKKEAKDSDGDSPLLWSGTTSHNFIKVCEHHYSQFEMSGFCHGLVEITLVMQDIKELMAWFNGQFKEAYEAKAREVATIRERNKRLRHIIEELNFFNFPSVICRTKVLDPGFSPAEQPERITRVDDCELSATPYLTPSQEELNLRTAEAERLRQLLLVDDFKEKALVAMMDGVLEKLWEDEIKKDVPKPKCMVEKEPENYSEEDLRDIRAYEEAVKFLTSERERYRKILEADWAKIIGSIRDVTNRFDERMAKLHVLKMKVESAIGQELLKVFRIRHSIQQKADFERKEKEIRLSIMLNEKKIEGMHQELAKLQEILNECKNYYETLQNRDRNLDKNFKKEFPDLSPVLCEQLYKLSKKRPKLVQKAALFSTLLIDLGKCTVACTKPDYLTAECIQFLKDVDALDSNANAPASVSDQAWDLMCKMRRAKIDCELKVRACAVDLGEAEATVLGYQRRIRSAKEQQTCLQNEINNLRNEKTFRDQNYSIQLVLKSGQIEIPLTGRISDFEDSILVTKETLTDINGIIRNTGNKKIRAMQKAANFRKGIIFKEWEHKKLKMEIEDLQSTLDTLEKIKVTKELQSILQGRARGFTEERGFLYLEEKLATVKEKFVKSRADLHRKIDDFASKIDKITRQNRDLEARIQELNADVNELATQVDRDFDAKQADHNMKRMRKLRYRSKLVQKIREQHDEILMLETELELQRLKTFPTLKVKT